MTGALARPLRAVVLFTAAVATLFATAATASAASAAMPPEPSAPPGPVQDLVLSPAPGNGARGLGFEVDWAPPAETGDGVDTHYVVEAYDAVGNRLESTSTGDTATEPIRGDRCRAPLSFAVRAVTRDSGTGDPLEGPTVRAEFGDVSLCEINNSIGAEQTGEGTLQVTVTREQPIDPYVAGPCTLTVDGQVAWSGNCGTREQTVDVDGLAAGGHDLVLTTVSPRGDTYTARTWAPVS